MTKTEFKDAAISGIVTAIAIMICWFVLVVFGSCATATHTTQANGKTVIITADTTVINHGGTLTIKTK